MTSNAPVSQNKRRALYRNVVLALLVLLLAWVALARSLGGLAHEVVHYAALALVLVMTLITVLWFRALDEAARQAHYVAWYWGSNLALAPVIVLFVILLAPGLISFAGMEALITAIAGVADARTGFMFGLVAAPLLMTVGYCVWWAVHWLRMS